MIRGERGAAVPNTLSEKRNKTEGKSSFVLRQGRGGADLMTRTLIGCPVELTEKKNGRGNREALPRRRKISS